MISQKPCLLTVLKYGQQTRLLEDHSDSWLPQLVHHNRPAVPRQKLDGRDESETFLVTNGELTEASRNCHDGTDVRYRTEGKLF